MQNLRRLSWRAAPKTAFRTLALALALGAGAAVISAPQTAQAAVAMDFSALVEQVSGGVVRVNTTKKMDADAAAQAQAVALLRRLLDERIDIPEVPAVEYGYGTGFFVTTDGYILTNHHVVENADTISVSLADRTELDAVLVGSDESSDVAVLKVKGTNFPALPIAKGDTLKVGEPVLAIGSPFGFDYSASAGIVSAKSRSIGREASVPFIQSDVALNPGNSGGPLFNQKGQVVGINSRIFSGTGGHMGLSFSIPMDAAMIIYEQIRATGKVVRAYIGVSVQDVDRNLAEVYGLKRPQGALLTRVAPDSPAEKAGLQRGDVVLSLNGTDITHAADLMTIISRARPNDSFAAIYRRAGENYSATGKFAQAPSDNAAESQAASQKIKLGLRLKALNSLEAKSLGLGGGVIIVSVDPTGLAARSGLQSGDVVLDLNHQHINSVADFSAALTGLPSSGVVAMSILRQGTPAIIGLRIE